MTIKSLAKKYQLAEQEIVELSNQYAWNAGGAHVQLSEIGGVFERESADRELSREYGISDEVLADFYPNVHGSELEERMDELMFD